MDDRWRQTFLSWSETDGHRRAVNEARSIINSSLAKCSQPYVAFSGGKDSTVMLHLVLEQCPEVMVWHAWSIWRPVAIEERIEIMAWELGAQQYEASRGLGARFFRIKEPELRQRGFDLAFVGLRTEEALSRKRRINAGRSLGLIQESWPLRSWRFLDVWAYILTQELPYLSVYDEEAAIVGWDQARFSTFHEPSRRPLGTESTQGVLHWRMRCDVGPVKHPWRDREKSFLDEQE